MDPDEPDDEVPDLLDLISGEEEEAPPARRVAHWCGSWVDHTEGHPLFCTYCGGW
jgi:hypothetical protein